MQQPSIMNSSGHLTPEEGKAIALELNRRAGENPLYGTTRYEVEAGRNVSWRLSPSPFALPSDVARRMEGLGQSLLAFYQAANKLYFESVKGRQPAWVHRYLDQGKPEALVDYQRMNRFRKALPNVIRPDLLLSEDGRLIACELDSVPGGIGMTGSMAQDYGAFGFEVLGGRNGLAEGFAAMIRSTAGKEEPALAIVVSEESNDYWHEQQWLGRELNALGLWTVVVRPGDLMFSEEGMLVEHEGERRRLDVVYRFFELFDLKNLPKSELLQYSAKKEHLTVTPPYKAFLEEKMLFAFFHHPVLAAYWRAELGDAVYLELLDVFPKTWILDPTPLPPHAVIPGLMVEGRAVSDWMELAKTAKKDRAFVIKPSGFSSLAWGSHGVHFGNDLSTQDWEAALKSALDAFPNTPYILQEFHKPAKTTAHYYHFRKEAVVQMEARARFCPYYYVIDGEASLHGALTTLCPLDKLAIHGMTDAIMVPTMAAP